MIRIILYMKSLILITAVKNVFIPIKFNSNIIYGYFIICHYDHKNNKNLYGSFEINQNRKNSI